MKKSSLIIIASIVSAILLIPFIAMQFTDQVSWNLMDFISMGILLSGTGLLCELAWRKTTKTKNRIFFIMAIVTVFLLVWAELAVGIFGTPLAGS